MVSTSTGQEDLHIARLSHQLFMQQMSAEERIRSEGDSGLKKVRLAKRGTRPYYSETHSGDSVMAIHDHSDYRSMAGMGELNMMMNGVEFKTRHNDFNLKRPSTTDSSYNAVEEIEFPGVPPAVTDLPNVEDQVEEMIQWFKAWNDQDDSVRNYTDYFKPVLVYMEGAWTLTDNTIDEPFTSDRHSLDAASWSDLHQKHYFTTQTGNKHKDENLAFLPTEIVDIVDDKPVMAQWNYRILCHPLNQDVPPDSFRVENELTTRLRHGWTADQLLKTSAARFKMTPRFEGFNTYGTLDHLMAEVPGKNNYGAHFVDDALGVVNYEYQDVSATLNVGYYQRSSLAREVNETGTGKRHRGFSDPNLFMAMTNHSEIPSTIIDECPEDPDTSCLTQQRWSYAVPLEIIYLTPLNSWNPHDIEYKGAAHSDLGVTVTSGVRDGGHTPETAYDGANNENYYITPSEFYAADQAETAKAVGVLNEAGTVTSNSASGIRVFFPNITGVGVLRQRYPIVPVHGHGSSVWKELEALKDIVLNPTSMAHHFNEVEGSVEGVEPPVETNEPLSLELDKADPAYGQHIHTLELSSIEKDTLMAGGEVQASTGISYGHSHTLMLSYNPPDPEVMGDAGSFTYVVCDTYDRGQQCGDGHPITLLEV